MSSIADGLQSIEAPTTPVCGAQNASNQTVISPESGRPGADPPIAGELESAVANLALSGMEVLSLRGGIYRLAAPLRFDQSIRPVKLTACPGERPIIVAPQEHSAVMINQARQVTIAGLTFLGGKSQTMMLAYAGDCTLSGNTILDSANGILLDHASNNLVTNNIILQTTGTAIEIKDGSDGNIITDNLVDGAFAPETSGGGIFLHGVANNRIAHNQVQNTAGFGIGVSNWDDATVNTGNVVEFNLLRQTAQTASDSGAIYVLGRSGLDTEMVVAGNIVEGAGLPDKHGVGIYLDDSTSGATVTHNLIRGAGSDSIQIHGGSDNLIDNNVIDLGAGQASAVLFQAAPADTHPAGHQTGNVVRRNVILSSNPSPHVFVWYDGGDPLITQNFYVVPGNAADAIAPPLRDLIPYSDDTVAASTAARDGYALVQVAAGIAGFQPFALLQAGRRQ